MKTDAVDQMGVRRHGVISVETPENLQPAHRNGAAAGLVARKALAVDNDKIPHAELPKPDGFRQSRRTGTDDHHVGTLDLGMALGHDLLTLFPLIAV
jgi:hypothetical protein